jgi:hypothetical protein
VRAGRARARGAGRRAVGRRERRRGHLWLRPRACTLLASLPACLPACRQKLDVASASLGPPTHLPACLPACAPDPLADC